MVTLSSSSNQERAVAAAVEAKDASSYHVNQENSSQVMHLQRAAIPNVPTKYLNASNENAVAASSTNQQLQQRAENTMRVGNKETALLRKFTEHNPFLITIDTKEKDYIEKLKSEDNIKLSKIKSIHGQSLLTQAVIFNKNEVVRYLLEKNLFDLDEVNPNLTPLMAAVYANNIVACKELIKAGAKIDKYYDKINRTYTAITIALQNDDKTNEVTNYLIDVLPEDTKQAVINRELRIAAAQGKLDNVEFLLNNHKADLFSCSPHYVNAISYASQNNHHHVVKFLSEKINLQLKEIEENEGKQAKDKKAADMAGQMVCHAKLQDFINFIEQEKLSVDEKNSPGQTFVFLASGWGHLDKVKFLVEQKNANLTLTCHKLLPVVNAAKFGHPEVVDYLLSRFDIGARTQQAQECLLSAAICGNNEMINHLLRTYTLSLGYKNELGQNALFLACGWGQLDSVQLLIKKGADSMVLCRGRYPSEDAARYGHLKIVDYLINLSKGRDRSLQLISCFTTSASWGKTEIVKLLLDKNPELINERDSDGYTAIKLAIYNGEHETVKYLLTQYSGEERKQHAIAWAPYVAKDDAVDTSLFEYLANNEGIDLNEKYNQPKSLFDRVVKKGHVDYVRFFIENGYKITLNGLKVCKKIEIFKIILENIRPEDVARIGFPNTLLRSESRKQVLTWMILRAGANSKEINHTTMYNSTIAEAELEDYLGETETETETDSETVSICTNTNIHMSAAFTAATSQQILSDLEEAVISGNTEIFRYSLDKVEKYNYSEEVLSFGYYNLNRAAYITLARFSVNEDFILELIAMGANPKAILENEVDLKNSTSESISEKARQFLIDVGDRSQYENNAALVDKIKTSYQSYFAEKLNYKRSADQVERTEPVKKMRLS